MSSSSSSLSDFIAFMVQNLLFHQKLLLLSLKMFLALGLMLLHKSSVSFHHCLNELPGIYFFSHFT
ncbi:hypothetical protein PsorP6_018395 [Peronosclerospora sorghi]|nr:hypothetical protein PsorP6_018381 [Peronosclerospora sorghi]KAI9895584.1 hypothetical protein PsorP6_018395 [Peronosclerospora sorghi]